MAKAEWGTKRTCLSCGARFYDLGRTPVSCPSCGTVLDLETVTRTRRGRSSSRAVPETPKAVPDDVEANEESAELAPDDSEDEEAEEEVVAKDAEAVVDDDTEEEEKDEDVLIEDADDLSDDDDVSDVIEDDVEDDDTNR